MEGFGLVALEAASCGRLVIASELEGIKDAIKPRKNGLLTPAGNKKEYLRLIIKELSAPSLIPNNIRRYTLENYSWKKTAQGYLDLINRMKQTG
jgi:glycosyltransferase involved in cell wall biosynthesis